MGKVPASAMVDARMAPLLLDRHDSSADTTEKRLRTVA
jgi:hypothetical protein